MFLKTNVLRAGWVVSVAVALAAAGPAAGGQEHSDPVGDSGGAPDITAMTVAHTARGTVTFTFDFANNPSFGDDELVVLALDTDQNRATGMSGGDGTDYFVAYGLGANTALVFRAPETLVGPATSTLANGKLTISFEKSQIGNPKAFDFVAFSEKGEGDADFDACPDSGWHTYSLDIQLVKLKFPAAVAKPVAGSTLSVRGTSAVLNTGETVKPTGLTATLKFAGKPVKALPGGNAWRIPKAAKGKNVTLTVTATYDGLTKTTTLNLRVR